MKCERVENYENTRGNNKYGDKHKLKRDGLENNIVNSIERNKNYCLHGRKGQVWSTLFTLVTRQYKIIGGMVLNVFYGR